MTFSPGDAVRIVDGLDDFVDTYGLSASYFKRATFEVESIAYAKEKSPRKDQPVYNIFDPAKPDQESFEAFEDELRDDFKPVTTDELKATFRSLLGAKHDDTE